MPSQNTALTLEPSHGGTAKEKLPPYLHVRIGIYYFVRKIPVKAAAFFKPVVRQVWKSLDTTDLHVALQRLAVEVKAFEALVAQARERASRARKPPMRKSGESTKYLLEAHIPFILSGYKHAHLSSDDDERKAMSREQRAERLGMLEEGLARLYDDVAAEDFSMMEEVADMVLENDRLIGLPGSAARQALVKELMRVDIELMEIQRDRLKGKIHLTPATQPVVPRELPTLLNLFESWRATQTEIRTIETYGSYVAQFEALCGPLPVMAITSAHADKFRDFLSGEELARETIKNRIGGLRTLVTFGVHEKLLGAQTPNPFDNVSLTHIPAKAAAEDRRAYEISELVKLFKSQLYTGGYRPEGQAYESSYWAPLLGPYVGARREEIAQLRMEDVQRVNGVWTLRIANLNEYQHLKTETSYRMVPLHEEVIRIGFLAYVAKMKLAGHERVFPSALNENKYGRWGNALGTWFSRYLVEIGLGDNRLCYQSFRYNFKQQATVCGVQTEIRDALAGHWAGSREAGKVYLRGADRQYPFPPLVDAIRSIHYNELDLSHLYAEKPYAFTEALV